MSSHDHCCCGLWHLRRDMSLNKQTPAEPPSAAQPRLTSLGTAAQTLCASLVGTHMIVPHATPKEPVQINELDLAMMHFPGVTAHNFYHSTLDTRRVKDAFARVLTNNPVLAGRLRSKRRDASGQPVEVEVHFDGVVGVPFHAKEMDPLLEFELQGFRSDRSVAGHPMEWEQMVEKLGIRNAGTGASQIDAEQDRPLCAVTYVAGKSTSALTLSVSHLLGDGSTYFQLLKAWDQEVAAPGSTQPMLGRHAVLEVDREFKSRCTQWEQDALKAFYPERYKDGYLSRNLLEYHMVSTSLSDSVLKAIKAEQQEMIGDGVIFSTQDSLIAWLGGTLRAKWFAFTVDLRGRSEALPVNTLGNAFQTWYGVPEAGPLKFSALDVRRAIDARGADIRPALEHALSTGLEDSIDVNSWLKLQYLPTFGADAWKQVRALGRGSMPFLFRMNYHVMYQIERGENIMFSFGLLREQAERLAERWRSLGATSTVTSGTELLDALGDDHGALQAELGDPCDELFHDLPHGLTLEDVQQFRESYFGWRRGDDSGVMRKRNAPKMRGTTKSRGTTFF
mmetsp:Transcript_70244/g.227434  ORF Transcript_70244/g.227434 Transcript_70244/m.227434 type:complete len:563 (+) Transcript_70244:79-1767(+)